MSRPGLERIVGRTIDLVEIDPQHFAKVVAWRNDPENQKFFFSQTSFTLEGQARWYERYQDDATDVTFILVLKSGHPVGMVALYGIDDRAGCAEFGRLLIGEPRCRGKGLGLEATQLCLKAAFKSLRLKQVYLEVYDWNQRAIGIYDRLGFITDSVSARSDARGGSQAVRKMIIKRETALPLLALAEPSP